MAKLATVSPISRKEPETEIREQIEGFVRALQSKDLFKMMSFYAPDVATFAVLAPLKRFGREAYAEMWRNPLSIMEKPIEFEIRNLNITASENLGFCHALSRMNFTVNGKKEPGMWVRWTGCFRKIDGNWLISHEHASIPADMETGKALFELQPEKEIVITRIFDAPREELFKAWTDTRKVMRWWGPKGFTMPFCKIDPRPGGIFHYCMRSPEGQDFWSRGVYREIVSPSQIVVTDSFSDDKGNVVPASHYGMGPDTDLEMLITAVFAEEKGKTRLTLQHLGLSSVDQEAAQSGWLQSFDRLDELLATS